MGIRYPEVEDGSFGLLVLTTAPTPTLDPSVPLPGSSARQSLHVHTSSDPHLLASCQPLIVSREPQNPFY